MAVEVAAAINVEEDMEEAVVMAVAEAVVSLLYLYDPSFLQL